MRSCGRWPLSFFWLWSGLRRIRLGPCFFLRMRRAPRWTPNAIFAGAPVRPPLPGGGSLTFEITPHDIPLVRPLELNVGTQGLNATGAEVDFSGVDMYMGFNRSKLEARAENRFSGSAMLPVCTRTRMEWEARVLLDTADGPLTVPFRFWTLNPGAE